MNKLWLLLALSWSSFAATTFNVTNTNWYFSPYNTYSDGSASLGSNNVRTDATKVVWANTGAYMAFSVIVNGSPGSIVLNVTENGCTACKIKYSINQGAYQTYTLTGTDTAITLGTGLSGQQIVWVGFYTVGLAYDRWTGSPIPAQSLQINSLTVTNAQFGNLDAVTNLPTNNYTKKAVLFGDSITEGYGTQVNAETDSFYSWAATVAQSLGANYGLIGYSGLGWEANNVGADNVPYFPSSWNLFFAGKSRLFGGKLSPMPDYVIVNHGRNDTGNIQATVQSWITAARAAVNTTTPIFVVAPFDGTEANYISAAVAAAADPYTYYILANYPSPLSDVNFNVGRFSFDNLHPKTEMAAMVAAKVTKAMQAATSTSGTSGGIIFQ